MRNQSQTSFIGEDGTLLRYWKNDPATDVSTRQSEPTTAIVVSRDEIRKGAIVDGWRYPLPYTSRVRIPGQLTLFSHILGEQYQGWDTSYDQVDVLTRSAFHYADINAAPEITSSIRSQALAKMHKHIADGKIELAVAILEGRESLEMVAKATKALALAITAVHRRDYVGAARALGVSAASVRTGAKPSDAWLQLVFGWMPLIKDLQAACAVLQGGQLANKFKIRAGAKVVKEVTSDEDRVWSQSIWDPFGRFQVPYTRTTHGYSSYSVSVYLALNNAPFRSLNQLGLINLPAIAWAVTPYSFLADWVIGIGDVLGTISSDVGLTFISGSESYFRRAETSHSGGNRVDFTPTAGQRVLEKSFDFIAFGSKIVEFDRHVLGSLPYPDALYFKNPLDPWKAVTASALLRQRFK